MSQDKAYGNGDLSRPRKASSDRQPLRYQCDVRLNGGVRTLIDGNIRPVVYLHFRYKIKDQKLVTSASVDLDNFIDGLIDVAEGKIAVKCPENKIYGHLTGVCKLCQGSLQAFRKMLKFQLGNPDDNS